MNKLNDRFRIFRAIGASPHRGLNVGELTSVLGITGDQLWENLHKLSESGIIKRQDTDRSKWVLTSQMSSLIHNCIVKAAKDLKS